MRCFDLLTSGNDRVVEGVEERVGELGVRRPLILIAESDRVGVCDPFDHISGTLRSGSIAAAFRRVK